MCCCCAPRVLSRHFLSPLSRAHHASRLKRQEECWSPPFIISAEQREMTLRISSNASYGLLYNRRALLFWHRLLQNIIRTPFRGCLCAKTLMLSFGFRFFQTAPPGIPTLK